MFRRSHSPRAQEKLDELSGKGLDAFQPRTSYTTRGFSKHAARFGRRYMRLMIFAAMTIAALRYYWITQAQGSTPRERHLIQHGASRHSAWPGWPGIKTIVAFGDSHTETGFDLDGIQPNPSNPIGNPPLPGRTANFGPNYLVHMTATLNESFIETYNFASMGSYLQPRDNPNFIPGPILMKQVDEIFGLRYGPTTGIWSGDTTLFVFYSGADDSVLDFYTRGQANKLRDVRSVQRPYAIMLRLLNGSTSWADGTSSSSVCQHLRNVPECGLLRSRSPSTNSAQS